MALDLTANQRVADLLLFRQGTTLEKWLTARRADIPRTSYETIAKELYVLTNGEVDVSYTTVKRWLIDFGLLQEAAS